MTTKRYNDVKNGEFFGYYANANPSERVEFITTTRNAALIAAAAMVTDDVVPTCGIVIVRRVIEVDGENVDDCDRRICKVCP